MSRLVAALSVVFLSLGAAAAAVSSPLLRPIAVVLDDAAPGTRAGVTTGIVALGGRVLHTFGDVLVVELPTGSELAAYRLAGIREVALNGLRASQGRRAGSSSFGLAAWNAISGGASHADRDAASPAPIQGDALRSPQVPLADVRAASRGRASRGGGSRGGGGSQGGSGGSRVPLGATELNTSEFLAGSVSVNIVLLESDGSIDPSTENWSQSRELDVVSRIALALEWIRTQEPQSALSFVYHVVPGRTDLRARTGLEPIRRAADPTGASGEDRWAKEILAKLGYATGDRFARSRAFASDTRLADGTDWAVNVFVVDSLADADGRFADGRFAYAWIGGPHLVMTYDNETWGIGRMEMVLRHELLHAFYAFDEYAASGCVCTDHRGYLDGPNANCERCNASAEDCVMIANGDALCDATRRHVGWADLDSDGAIDVVGQDPDTFLDATPPIACGAPVLSGLATVVAATNRNTFAGTDHPSISVNRIADVELSVDGSPWASAAGPLSTEAAGARQRPFRMDIGAVAPGSHRFEVRAVDDFGNRDQDPASVSVLVHGVAEALGDSVRASRAPAGVALTWGVCRGATRYRVYRRFSPAEAERVAAETSSTSWSDTGSRTAYYQVRPVDACGGERLP